MLGPKFFRTTTDISANLSFPRMMRTHIERGIASCSTGYDRSILKKSLGEALERHMCFSKADIDAGHHILDEYDPKVFEWFVKNCDIAPDPAHKFSSTEVIELSTDTKYIVPLVAFYLGESEDSQIYGARDSSGTALHQSWEMAFLNCRNEFCERQSLTLFWYFGHCLASVSLKESSLYDEVKGELTFISFMLSMGDILVFDISYLSPVRTVLCVYVSENGIVKFAAGASGDTEILKALKKALLEMYQAFVLMLNLNDERTRDSIDINDSIIEGYISHNNIKTVKKIKQINLLKQNKQFLSGDNFKFKKDFYSECVFLHNREIIFSDKILFYCVMKSLFSFKTMSLDERYRIRNLNAAKYYGYDKQINKGPIPFA